MESLITRLNSKCFALFQYPLHLVTPSLLEIWENRRSKGEFGSAFCKVHNEKVKFSKVHFQKAKCLVKAVKQCFLKKLSVWLALIKVVV